MKQADLDQVIAIEQSSFSMPWSRNLFQSEFRNRNVSLMLVARAPGQDNVVGYIVCWVVADELHILDLATEPSMRRKGIARMLVLAALKRGYDRGALRAFLEVRQTNMSALMLYDGLGFSRSIVREGYYDLPVEDAVIMSLERDGLELLLNRQRSSGQTE